MTTVILPVKNGMATLPALLDRVAAQETDFPFDVLAVDSGSTDGSVELLESRGVRVVRIAPEEFGHGRTRNFAASLATGRYVAFLTQDALPVGPHWLAEMVRAAEISPRVAGVYGRHVAHRGASPFARYAVEAFTGAVFSPGLRIDRIPDGAEPTVGEEILRFFSNNNSLVRREVLAEIPFPDVEFAEDQAWALRAVEAGYWKVFTPYAVVEHSHDEEAGAILGRAFDESRGYRRLFDVRLLASSPLAVVRDAREHAALLGRLLAADGALTPEERAVWSRRRHRVALARAAGHWLGARSALDALPVVLRLSRDVRLRGAAHGREAEARDEVLLGGGDVPARSVRLAGHGIPVPSPGWTPKRVYVPALRRFVTGGFLDLNRAVSFGLRRVAVRGRCRLEVLRPRAAEYRDLPVTVELAGWRGRDRVFGFEIRLEATEDVQRFERHVPGNGVVDRVELSARAECSVLSYSDRERLFVVVALGADPSGPRPVRDALTAVGGGLAAVSRRLARPVLRPIERLRVARELRRFPKLVHAPPTTVDDSSEVTVPLALSAADLAATGAASVAPDERTVHWVIPPFGRGSGGHSNIFAYVKRLADLGIPQRVSVTPPVREATGEDLATRIERWFGVRVPVENGFSDPPCAVLVATGWATAYRVKLARGARRRLYFVQDLETEFFPASSERLLAEQTYRLGLPCVTLGPWLAAELGRRFGIEAAALPFAYDDRVYFRRDGGRRARLVAVYLRPVTPRRATLHLVEAVRQLAARDPDLTIILFGSEERHLVPLDLVRGRVVWAGALSLRELNELYNTALCGVAVSLTNPVLTHLEMMAAGCPVVDFDGPASRSLLTDGFDSLLSPPTAQDLAGAIDRVVSDDALRERLCEGCRATVAGRDYGSSVRVLEALLTGTR